MLRRKQSYYRIVFLVLLGSCDIQRIAAEAERTAQAIPRRGLQQDGSQQQQDVAPVKYHKLHVGGEEDDGKTIAPGSAAAANLQQKLTDIIGRTLNGEVKPTGTAPTRDAAGRKLKSTGPSTMISKEGVPLALPPRPELSAATKVSW